MWEFFIKNNRFSYLLLLALFGFGVYSMLAIAKESSPEVQVPVGIVATSLIGASAADVESLVTNEIEQGITGSLENVKDITSTSREGMSMIVVEFEASADIDASIADLKDAVDTIIPDLPEEASDPAVSEVNFVDQPIMTIAVSGDRSDFAFSQIVDDFENEIETISGISKVESRGVRDREVSVIVEPTELKRYGISLSAVTSALQLADQSLPVGKIENEYVLYNVSLEGDISSTEDIEEVGVAIVGGQPVYIRDVATVVDGMERPVLYSRYSENGEPSQRAISFYVYKQRGGDITVITDTVAQHIVSLQQDGNLLSDLDVAVVLNSGDDIKESLGQLTSSGLQTVLLVVFILVLAIGWREGLIAGLSIPLTFLFGFIGLYLSGNTINFLSLFALILGIGVLVDSGIVIVEGINRRMKDDQNINKTDAALLTISEFSSPIIAGTLTTVSMFCGLFVVGGVTGQFISVIPFTLVFVLFSSLLVALGILPLIASTFLRRRTVSKLEVKQMKYSRKLEKWYRSKLEKIIGNRKNERRFLWIIRIALVLALLLPVVGVVKVVFFEQSDVDYLIVEVELPEGSILSTTDIATRRVEDILYTEKNIDSFLTTVGAGSEFASGEQNEKMGNIFITLRDNRDKTSTELLEQLRGQLQKIDDVKVTITQPSDGPPAGAPVSVTFIGTEMAELTQAANRAALLLKSIDGSVNVRTSANNNSTEFVITLDNAKVAQYGLNPMLVSSSLRTAVYGTEVASLTTIDTDTPVVVKLNATDLPNPTVEDLRNLTIDSLTHIEFSIPSGGTVLLSSLVDISLREASAIIEHENGQRVVSVSSDITAEGNAMEIQTAFLNSIEQDMQLPADVAVMAGGETDESNSAFKDLFLALIIGIVLMLAVLVLQFNSYTHTKHVLSILPYSLIGILLGLAITGNALSFPSIMGFIALSGIVVNNSILLIDMMNIDRRKHPDKEIRDVVIDSAVGRLRPILLTTLTTVIGMIPLTFVGDLWAPLAYAVMFGLLFSVVITLVLVPISYDRNPG
jgi:multidrug efflux pump subunit AcrB